MISNSDLIHSPHDPNDRRIRPCKGCGAKIMMLVTNQLSTMPVDAETVGILDRFYDSKKHKAHFATCPQAEKFRRKEK